MDHHFIVDKSLYDIAASDLREIWDADIDPHEFKIEDDWSPGGGGLVQSRSQVIIHDRLMSDAVLGGDSTPIKSEHSYCSQLSNSSTPPPISGLIKDDVEDDCLLPAVPPKTTSGRVSSPIPFVVIKSEPMSGASSPASSCPSSPSPPPPRSVKASIIYTDMFLNSKPMSKTPVKQLPTTTMLSNKSLGMKRKHQMISANIIKIEPSSTSSTRFPLPPTPPSCASSDNEGNVSPLHPSSSDRSLFLSGSTTTRQPIQTPLISSQPKGSTGMLLLTEEEKRTLVAEGYPIPVRLPLTKAEEKCLKKIRRKIKNKISAQESRRKKKEYMDALERKVEILSTENADFKQQICSLEDANCSLTSQVNRLQNVIARLGGVNTRNALK
uniref:Cyclic AMP response element-binding protein A n=1 Tax=Lygus hesperus TaxID=30085 RepID=A0A0A9Z3X4_LYGHE